VDPDDPNSRFESIMLGMDTMLMLTDLKNFIDFSEENIRWQQKRELYQAKQESQREDVYRRFRSLLQQVRYTALITLLTVIERVATKVETAAERMDRSIPRRPAGKNKAVHLFEVVNKFNELGWAQQLQILETLTQVRNCIVHAAGLIDEYEHGAQLRLRLADFDGIRISDDDFWGQDTIEFEEGYLQSQIEDAKAWLLKLFT
jgi:hypothetical protein